MPQDQPRRLYEFGVFSVDARERTLSRDGLPVQVTPKVFDVLLALVENHGRTLGKDELIDRVWADSFVEAGNVNRSISTLRSVLGDDRHEPKFIKTFPKRGYRFDADVREVVVDEESFVIERRRNYRVAVTETTGTAPQRSGDRIVATAAIAAISLAIVAGFASIMGGRAGARVGPDRESARAEALQFYQQGRSLWRDRTGESLHKATLMLEQAIQKDPQLAIAHAALADAYAFDLKNRTKAEEAARAAISLDPALGEPHATIGFIRMFWEWDLEVAEEHLKRAVTLSPDYATGHQWYAIALAARGGGTAALAEMKKALELEPASVAINADMCQVLYFTRRYEEAEQQCRKTLEMDPRFLTAHLYLYDVLTAQNKYDEAVEQFFKAEAIAVRYNAAALDELRSAYAAGGIRAFWKKRIEMLESAPNSRYSIAVYQARRGDYDAALTSLKTAYERRDLDFLYFLPELLFLDCCFNDPRYTELETKMRGPRNRN